MITDRLKKIEKLQRELQRDLERLQNLPEVELMSLLVKWNCKMARHVKSSLKKMKVSVVFS